MRTPPVRRRLLEPLHDVYLSLCLSFCVALATSQARAAGPASATPAVAAPQPAPVTPQPSPEAVKLLEYIQAISGKNTLVGQHCAPLIDSSRLVVIRRSMKHYPALFGQDFGFDAGGMWDGINFRQRIVDEAIRRHQEGFIISLMWHAVRPTEDEPVTFEKSIQGELTAAEWQELVTPGSALNERWQSQVDVVAWFLKQLRTAHVPVLWRPYHEMNGDWFWWGKKPGKNGYQKLYRMLFDRFVSFHGLNNLLWVYNANEVRAGVDPYAVHYPGADVVDILATDVYRGGFADSDYRQLLALAQGKPIALGEVGQPPSLAVLKQQPRWSWFMLWGDLPERGQSGSPDFSATYESSRTLTHDELPWVTVKDPQLHYPVLQ
jgi:mannan endo-1,4-beta-mannosidase